MEKPNIISKISDRLYLTILLIIGAAIQLAFMAKASIWHDEGYSLLLIKSGWTEIIARTIRDVHPPLYYLDLKAWSLLFGTSEVAVRSLSMVYVLATTVVAFLLVRRLFGQRPARVSALLITLAPFLVRYGQEARMYAMAAFLAILATYLLVSAVDEGNKKRLYAYAAIMALGFYTHYYLVFIVPVHWLYVLMRTKRQDNKQNIGLKNKHWWLTNVLIAVLFAPWLPAMYSQFTRVQGGFWIPAVNGWTLPSTLKMLTLFLSAYPPEVTVIWAALGFTLLVALAIFWNSQHRSSLILLASYALFAPLAVFGISLLGRPVYIDRYFVFSSVGFYALLGVLLYVRPLNYLHKLRPLFILAMVGLFALGLRNIYLQANHGMREVGQYVNNHYRTGDALVAGELYVYFDYSYYNQTNEPLRLYAPGGVSGYGETSLIYDQPELIINSFSALNPESNTVWVVGKPGDKSYFSEVPPGWKLVDSFENHSSVVRKYSTQ